MPRKYRGNKRNNKNPNSAPALPGCNYDVYLEKIKKQKNIIPQGHFVYTALNFMQETIEAFQRKKIPLSIINKDNGFYKFLDKYISYMLNYVQLEECINEMKKIYFDNNSSSLSIIDHDMLNNLNNKHHTKILERYNTLVTIFGFYVMKPEGRKKKTQGKISGNLHFNFDDIDEANTSLVTEITELSAFKEYLKTNLEEAKTASSELDLLLGYKKQYEVIFAEVIGENLLEEKAKEYVDYFIGKAKELTSSPGWPNKIDQVQVEEMEKMLSPSIKDDINEFCNNIRNYKGRFKYTNEKIINELSSYADSLCGKYDEVINKKKLEIKNLTIKCFSDKLSAICLENSKKNTDLEKKIESRGKSKIKTAVEDDVNHMLKDYSYYVEEVKPESVKRSNDLELLITLCGQFLGYARGKYKSSDIQNLESIHESLKSTSSLLKKMSEGISSIIEELEDKQKLINNERHDKYNKRCATLNQICECIIKNERIECQEEKLYIDYRHDFEHMQREDNLHTLPALIEGLVKKEKLKLDSEVQAWINAIDEQQQKTNPEFIGNINNIQTCVNHRLDQNQNALNVKIKNELHKRSAHEQSSHGQLLKYEAMIKELREREERNGFNKSQVYDECRNDVVSLLASCTHKKNLEKLLEIINRSWSEQDNTKEIIQVLTNCGFTIIKNDHVQKIFVKNMMLYSFHDEHPESKPSTVAHNKQGISKMLKNYKQEIERELRTRGAPSLVMRP